MGSDEANSAGRRVLVVDDNADIAEVIAEYLSAHGHEVRVAYDGAAVVDTVVEFRPAAIVLDIGLPVIDGFELARTLRSAYGGGLKLIATTGYGMAVHRARGLEAGFDHYLVKPIDLEVLARLIQG